jgi:hypothetical protein
VVCLDCLLRLGHHSDYKVESGWKSFSLAAADPAAQESRSLFHPHNSALKSTPLLSHFHG